MITKLLISVFLFLTVFTTSAQKLDKQYIDNWITKTFEGAIVDNHTIYMINGLMLGADRIGWMLLNFKPTDLTTIDWIEKSKLDSSIFRASSGIISLITKGQQSSESIIADFNLVKSKFKKDKIRVTDNVSYPEPALIINGVSIQHNDRYDKISTLNFSRIIGINFIQKPVSQDIYGRDAKNGLVIITLR